MCQEQDLSKKNDWSSGSYKDPETPVDEWLENLSSQHDHEPEFIFYDATDWESIPF